MALAINVRADNASANEIERLWDQVAAFEDEPSMRILAYQPHVTFAIYDSPDIDEKTAWGAMQSATIGGAQLPIAFRRIRGVAGPPLVLWAEPEANETLGRWHAAISAAVDPSIVGHTTGPALGHPIVPLAQVSPLERARTPSPLRSRLTALSK